MSFDRLLASLTLLTILSSNASAELKLINKIAVPFEISSPLMKLISDDGQEYVIATNVATTLRKNKSSFLKVENFFSGNSSWQVKLDDSPTFQATGAQHGLLAVANGQSEWSVIKLNKSLTKVENKVPLKSMLAVGQINKVFDKYYINGINKTKQMVLLKMDSSLRIERVRISDPKTAGVMSSVFTTGTNIYAIVSFVDRAEIWRITPDLSPLNKIILSGQAYTAVPLKDGGFAVAYMNPKNFEHIVERFDSHGRSAWKKSVFTVALTGAGTLPTLCELPDGVCLVAGNNDRLLIARINAKGNRVLLTEDVRSGLGIPSDPVGYLVGVIKNEIHVRGRVRASDASGSTILFHFVETPRP